jgi:hypothetical protein
MIGLSTFPATAATFSATIEGKTIIIFSHSDKEEVCSAWVPFSYWYKGKREHTFTKCLRKTLTISEKIEMCRMTNVEIVKPKIEGPVVSLCNE